MVTIRLSNNKQSKTRAYLTGRKVLSVVYEEEIRQTHYLWLPQNQVLPFFRSWTNTEDLSLIWRTEPAKRGLPCVGFDMFEQTSHYILPDYK